VLHCCPNVYDGLKRTLYLSNSFINCTTTKRAIPVKVKGFFTLMSLSFPFNTFI
jgi:hypothetical protein